MKPLKKLKSIVTMTISPDWTVEGKIFLLSFLVFYVFYFLPVAAPSDAVYSALVNVFFMLFKYV